MKSGGARETAVVAVALYLLLLWGHATLTDLAAFALFAALAGLSAALSAPAARPNAPLGTERPATVTGVRSRRGAAAATLAPEAALTALAQLEAELHALEDQRLTELARTRGGA